MGGREALAIRFLATCVTILLVSLGPEGVHATTYSVENRAPTTDGGIRFTNEMGNDWTLQMLARVQAYIVQVLSPSYRQVDHITFIVENFDGAAFNSNNEIHVSSTFLANIQGDLRFEIEGLMYHEVCHSFQNNRGQYGTDLHFTGVIEGIATYIELIAGFGIGPKVKGRNWYDGYEHTAHFLNWIDQNQKAGFVNLLNQKMGEADWNDNFFFELTGKDVNLLWEQYQASF